MFKKLTLRKTTKKNKDNSGDGKIKRILSQVSGAFMLPISVMAIAGLLLGIGATIEANTVSHGAKLLGKFIKNLGDPVFGGLPLLFAAAFVIAFTNEAGVGVFAAVISYLVFSALQSVFIHDVTETTYAVFNNTAQSGQEVFVVSPDVLKNNDLLSELAKVSGKAVDQIKEGDRFLTSTKLTGYNILFTQGGRAPEAMKNLVGSSLGFKTLQTSIFGGIAIGIIVSILYNKFNAIQLPTVISFFGGKRFVSLVSILAMIPLSFIFLLFWPWVGVGLNYLGYGLGKVPYGFESFIFGFIERSLIPFGLHHAFYAPLWYTPAGGDMQSAIENFEKAGNAIVGSNGLNLKELVASSADAWKGDSLISTKIAGLSYNTIDFTLNGSAKIHTLPILEFVSKHLEIKVGRFMQGKYSFMMFGLPAAAVAMIFAAPKENRKVALGTVLPAGLTSMITGVTEPIEFTFLFLAPWLFWGVHALFAAFSFMFANVLGAHVGMVFSGGIFDLIFYGIIPFQKGTNFWWVLVVGLAYIPLYFFTFYFAIKRFNLETPGRGNNTKLFTKKDYLAKNNKSNLDPKVVEIVQSLGGVDNISVFNNCASRLRYDIKDRSLINEERLKAVNGVAGIAYMGDKNIQIIVGPVADQLNSKIKNSVNELKKLPTETNQQIVLEKEEKTTENVEDELKNVENSTKSPIIVKVPTIGKLESITKAGDQVFANKILGDGAIIRFAKSRNEAKIYAPIDGKLVTVFGTKHAYGIQSTNGDLNLLLHIGIDTVNLNGKGFTSHVKQDQEIKAGKLLATVDLKIIREANLIPDLLVIVLTDSKIRTVTELNEGNLTKNSKSIFTVK